MHWVGALEVIGPTTDTSPIWALDAFPVRFSVKPLVMLDAEYGVPMERFEGRLDFYGGVEHRGGFKGFLRMSPNLFKRPADGALILEAVRDAERNPVATSIDPRKLARKPNYFKVEFRKGKVAVPTVVSVPEQDDDDVPVVEPKSTGRTSDKAYRNPVPPAQTWRGNGARRVGGSQRPKSELQRGTTGNDGGHAR